MLVTLFPPRRADPQGFATRFALQQDNWNDFSFQTLYHLYYRPEDEDGESIFVGSVKILKSGQTAADTQQITTDFDSLGREFCSLGQSLDYYMRLNSLSENDRQDILSALRDIVAMQDIGGDFEDEEGWSTSLFRNISLRESYLQDAEAILTNSFSNLPDLDLPFSFLPAGWRKPLDLEFGAPEPDAYNGPWRRVGPRRKRVLLPRRIAVLIGRNNSGKSTLLSRIARVAFASPQDRTLTHVSQIGSFDPVDIGFMRIITISYSAFDSFRVPGVYESDLEQIARDIEKGEGRFIFCGLRNIVAEVRDDLSYAAGKTSIEDERVELTPEDWRNSTHLKSLSQLADEFERLIHRIEQNGQIGLFQSAVVPLLADPSFSDLEEKTIEALLGDDSRSAFLAWSTGHKIALHIIASVIAHAVRKSLVLFDEPETHLHPPLIAALMHSLRIVLEETNAFALIATHSPVVLQETLARHVRIIRRIGDHFEIHNPETETFGENVGILTYDAFGLTATTTDFHDILDLLIEGCGSLEEIDALFTPHLSGQARAYVMARLKRTGGEPS